MNVLAGIIIGYFSDNWAMLAEYVLFWSLIHVTYGFGFRLHNNVVVATSKKGSPVLSFYLARFSVAIFTAGLVASATWGTLLLLGYT